MTLVSELRSLADCDARAGAPLGNALRHWADFIEAVLEQSPNGEPVEVAIHPNGDWSVYASRRWAEEEAERQRRYGSEGGEE